MASFQVNITVRSAAQLCADAATGSRVMAPRQEASNLEIFWKGRGEGAKLLREIGDRMKAVLHLRAAGYAEPGIFAMRLGGLNSIFLGRHRPYNIQMVRERLGIE
jgi:hypothetical protein